MMWVNGQLLADAMVSAEDHGFTVGDGVFETVKTINGRPFALTRHLQRLRDSADGMQMPLPNFESVRDGVSQLLDANPFEVGRLRITWTTGSGGAGSQRASEIVPTLIISHHEASPWPVSAKVATVAWPRSERSPLVHLKTTSYAENVLALSVARSRGADEALFFNYADQLCEGTGSNVIVRIAEKWVTPALDCGVLPGVTRALAMSWCGVVEGVISREEFESAEEILLSSTTRNLQPVSVIDGRELSGWKSNAMRELVEAFDRMASEVIDP